MKRPGSVHKQHEPKPLAGTCEKMRSQASWTGESPVLPLKTLAFRG